MKKETVVEKSYDKNALDAHNILAVKIYQIEIGV